MTEESPSQGGLLADRLDYLFRTVHPKDRGPYTPAEVAEAINETAGERVISSTYVWQLRTGRRDNPTQRHLSALAAFFGVSPMYFFQQTEADRDTVPPELIAALRNDEVPAGKLSGPVSGLPVVRGGPLAADQLRQSVTVASGAREPIGTRPMPESVTKEEMGHFVARCPG